MNIRRKRIEFTVFCTLFIVIIYSAYCQSCQTRLSEDIVRFRVVANSDSEKDQSVKLAVRDAVILQLSEWQDKPKNAQDMLNIIDERQEEIMNTVKSTLKKYGVSQQCRIVTANSLYPTRDYDSFSLPAGKYNGVQIFLGSGQGHNWWCVIYPSLCIDAASGEKQLSDDENGLIHTKNTKYAVRFKTAEMIGELENMLS